MQGGNNILRCTKYITVILIGILLCPSILSQNVSAQTSDSDPEEGWPFPVLTLIGFLKAQLHPIFQFNTDKVKIAPETVEIGYGETVTVELGMVDMLEGTDEFTELTNYPFFLAARFLDFRADFLGNGSGGWFVNFAPSRIYFEEGSILKTIVTISLDVPRDAEDPIQSNMLRINVTDTWVIKNLWWNEEGWSPFWTFSAITVGFGKLSGKVAPEYYEFDVLVRVKPYISLNIEPVPLVKLSPNQITSIPINIENLGNYKDTFSFRVTNEYDDIKIIDPASISLQPGEKGQTVLGVSASNLLLDVGTLYPLTIEAYVIDQPNVTIASQNIFLETKGIYVSEINGAYFVFFVILVIVGLAFFVRRRRRKLDIICQKPDKPWEIPEEKKHLEQLKKSDKEEYNNILNMMEDEYKSSLLWYKDYCKAMLDKARQKKKPTDVFGGIKNSLSNATKRIVHIFRRPESKIGKPVKTKPKKPLKKEIKEAQKMEEVKPTEITEEEQKPTVDLATEREKRRREQAILRAKRAQEKQRRKFKRPSY